MSITNPNVKSGQRHLEVFEGWRVDHDAAMECYKLEDWMAEGCSVFAMLERDYSRVCQAVYRGDIPATSEQVENSRKFYGLWLAKAIPSLPTLAKYEAAFGSVLGAEQFRELVGRVQRTLAEWAPPTRALSPGMQPWVVTQEEAAELLKLTTAPAGSPGTLARDLRTMPAGDASLIR